MKLIVGLGNIGEKYVATRHNIGFVAVDALKSTLGTVKTQDKFQAEIAISGTGDDKLILAKPSTMMNLSGEAVGKLMRFYKINPQDVWVISDDVDLPFGTFRVRQHGGSGGHNGLGSLIEHIGDGFWRFRLGVSNEHFDKTPTDQYVLDDFSSAEKSKLPVITDQIVEIINDSLRQGDPTAMTYKLV
jgi:PTH1 family peptidyl-tRNA hydrolase